MVETHSANAGSGSKSHPREPSGRLTLNEAMAARIPVASAPAMPMTKTGCWSRSARSWRTPCTPASSVSTNAANKSHDVARNAGGRRRRTGVAQSTSVSMRSGVFVIRFFRCQHFAQAFDGAMGSDLESRDRPSARRGCLLQGHFVQFKHPNRLTLFRRQPLNRFIERGLVVPRLIEVRCMVVKGFMLACELDLACPLPRLAPHSVDDAPVGDGEQPGAERAAGIVRMAHHVHG